MSTSDRYQILRAPAEVGASVSYTGTAGSITQAVRGTCVRLWCTTDALVSVGAAATANSTPLQAYETLWLPLPENVNQGDGNVIIASAIQVASGGTLFAQQFQ